jgi:hypothetical protein
MDHAGLHFAKARADTTLNVTNYTSMKCLSIHKHASGA